MMFPNGMEFMPDEHCQDLMLEAEKARLIKEAGLSQSNQRIRIRNVSICLGSQLVKFGLMLQGEIIKMSKQQIKPYRSYLLHFGSATSSLPNQPPTRLFIIEDVSKQKQRLEFCTLEQVMNFLLDELLGQPEEVPEKG